MQLNAITQELVDQLDLQPHPEGGFFRETWRSRLLFSNELPETYDGSTRNAGTSIYFLLPEGERSKPHRVLSDEMWLFHAGDPIRLRMRPTPDDEWTEVVLGGDTFQTLVPGGWWQEAEPAGDANGYSLVGCVVVPGFDFEDFEMEN